MKKMSRNKMNRRMIYLMSITWPMEYDKFVELKDECDYRNPILDEIFELAKNLKVLGDVREIWWENYRGSKFCEERQKYNKMPKRPRQDNKDFINKGSGHPQRGWLRYPRKKRKTAWKRFYKLFPHLKPKGDEE